ncbi:unknown protein [Azorhizobium caulinodans ORS 571]|uniref:Uncharacterized protein n=1 Tax=Azorhizobium caulinodans (strain ATCC 43989 / DSM 5975 / JCM 20966 / LMG 6465 / NBRC 14845 / NCIMB 13405 / ORS 571) TaxID=438753 RepID=A8IFB7_AZOC5|nr:hypothetical protein [Azorhizobium caulinodans]BAF89597.1 unknown protein [Azorhizobium caulinodans ORS 571]
MFAFPFTLKTVSSITSGLQKMIADLDALTAEREAMATAKEREAADLITSAHEDREEAMKARRVADKINELVM